MRYIPSVSIRQAAVVSFALTAYWAPLCPALSILSVGFDEPLIQGGSAYLLHRRSGVLTCLDLATKSVRWRQSVGRVQRLSVCSDGGIMLASVREGVILDPVTGGVRQRLESTWMHGDSDRVLATDADGDVYCAAWENKHVRRIDPHTDTVRWEYDAGGYCSRVEVIDAFAFVRLRPIGPEPSEPPSNVLVGPHRVVALRLGDGAPVWSAESGAVHPVVFQRGGDGTDGLRTGSFDVVVNVTTIACSVGREVRLLDRGSCRSIGTCVAASDVRALAWWGESTLVIGLDDVELGDAVPASDRARLQIVRLPALKPSEPFPLPAPARSLGGLCVAGDVLLAGWPDSVAFDLVERRPLWTGPSRDYHVSDGVLYYTEYTRDSVPGETATFGICDAKTGSVRVLYAQNFD